VLQDATRPPGFHFLTVDLTNGVLALTTFKWAGSLFTAESTTRDTLQLNGSVAREPFEISQAFDRWLDDPGASLTHHAKANVSLADIFVWPYVREITYTKKKGKLISAERFVEHALSEKRILITAPERAGKTTLCKQIFRMFRQRKLVPV